jgi:GNAT superfamily N-acetyltransferase
VPDKSARRSFATAAVATRPRSRVVVRPATPDDLTEIATMRLALLQEEAENPFFANPHPDSARRTLRLTETELAVPDQVFFLATRGRRAVGMLRCRAVQRTPLVAEARQAVVTTAYVVPTERRKGVLRALLAACDRWCRTNHLPAMRLQCSLTNDVGQRTWESLGFQPAEVVYLRDVPQG